TRPGTTRTRTWARRPSPDDPLDHPERELVAAERRHDVRPVDTVLDHREHLARDAHALVAPLGAAAGHAHALSDVDGDAHAGDLVVQELRVSIARQRQEPDEHGDAEGADVVQEA